jgi:hypothetical protein
MTAQMPPGMSSYLERMMNRTPVDTVPTPDAIVQMVAMEIAQSILWAFLFVLIWLILSIMIKAFMDIIFIGGDGKTLIGVVDGLLGMVVMTFIVVASMIVFSGAVFPFLLLTDADGSISRVYPALMESNLFSWMASIYQSYVIAWLN